MSELQEVAEPNGDEVNKTHARTHPIACIATATLALAGLVAGCGVRNEIPQARPSWTTGPASQPATAPTSAPVAAPASKPTSVPASRPAARRADLIDEIEKFEAADAAAMPAPGGIVFYGSSTIRLWKTADAFAELPTINRGFGGSNMAQALMYDRRVVFKYKPKVVVLYEGDNDMQGGRSPGLVADEYKVFARRLRETAPDAKLVILSVKPSPSRWRLQPKMTELNATLKAFADENAAWVTYVDLVPPMLGANGEPRPELYLADRLHMSEAGYAIWNDALRPVLTKLLNN